jgi:hypothetical protein
VHLQLTGLNSLIKKASQVQIMSQVISIGYLALLLVLCMSTRPNQSAQVLKKSSAKLSNETIKDKVDDFLLAILRCHSIPGANLALVHHGQVSIHSGNIFNSNRYEITLFVYGIV